jgi:hypothetical protein
VLGEARTEAAHLIPQRIANDIERQLRANSGHSSGISQLLIDILEKRPEHINSAIR